MHSNVALNLFIFFLFTGVTSDEMLKSKKKASSIEGLDIRISNVRNFLSLILPSLRLEVMPITDPFGPTIIDDAIEAIVVSSETITGAHKINEIRRSKGLPLLSIGISRRADTATLSSTFIREKNDL